MIYRRRNVSSSARVEKERARKRAVNERWRRKQGIPLRTKEGRNPAVRKASNWACYARSFGAVGKVTPLEWADILAKYENRCAYCASDSDLTQDHVTPLSKGGTHTADNVVPSCRSCNAKKGAKVF